LFSLAVSSLPLAGTCRYRLTMIPPVIREPLAPSWSTAASKRGVVSGLCVSKFPVSLANLRVSLQFLSTKQYNL
jgi:hypothetical protein